jgi:phosphoglycolate phosphatase
MNCRLVVFDLDGTLIDTIADLGAAVNEALASKGLPLHSLEEYRGMVGHGVRNLVKKAMPEPLRGDEVLLDTLLEKFLAYYLAHIDVQSRAYPGIAELLVELHAAGVLFAVASNKFQAGTERLVRRTFPGIPFAAVCGGRPDLPLKPDPAIIREILARTGVRSEETVMVGDSGTDIATAKAAGIPCVAVTWGFRPRAALQGADRIVESVAQLRETLLPE